MAKDMREDWKETGVGLGNAFRALGKSIIKSGTTVLKKADDWANKEDGQKEAAEEEKKEEE